MEELTELEQRRTDFDAQESSRYWAMSRQPFLGGAIHLAAAPLKELSSKTVSYLRALPMGRRSKTIEEWRWRGDRVSKEE